MLGLLFISSCRFMFIRVIRSKYSNTRNQSKYSKKLSRYPEIEMTRKLQWIEPVSHVTLNTHVITFVTLPDHAQKSRNCQATTEYYEGVPRHDTRQSSSILFVSLLIRTKGYIGRNGWNVATALVRMSNLKLNDESKVTTIDLSHSHSQIEFPQPSEVPKLLCSSYWKRRRVL